MFFQKISGMVAALILWSLAGFGAAGFFGCAQETPESPPDEPPPPLTGRQITAFTVNGAPALIDEDAKTLTLTAAYVQDPAAPAAFTLTPVITLSPGAAVQPPSGAPLDFSQPVTYTVTAENGTSETYTVTAWARFSEAAEGLALLTAYLSATPLNNPAIPYYLALEGFDLSQGVFQDFYEAGLKGRYAAIDLSGCTGSTITNGFVRNSEGFAGNFSALRYGVRVILPSTLTSTGHSAFRNAGSLTSVTLGEGLAEISAETFTGAANLKTVQFPKSLQRVGESAFWNSGLEAVELPAGVTSIGTFTFSGTPIKTITLPSSVSTLRSNSFSDCAQLESADLSAANITTLEANVFTGCTNLKTVMLPGTLTGSLSSTFNTCTSLVSLDCSATAISALGAMAFMNCTSLEALYLPETITRIGLDETFSFGSPLSGCTALKTLVIPAANPPALGQYSDGKNALSDAAEDLVIYVPDNRVVTYKNNSQWSAYASHIKAISVMPQ
jgi:hypothetical protein